MQKILLSTMSLAALIVALPLALAADARIQGADVKVEGSAATLVPATEARLPKDALPGVKFISSEQFKQTKGPSESGVFIVDETTIPKNLQENLKAEGYRLQPDGKAVDAKGTPVAIFVRSMTYKIDPKQKQGALPGGLGRLAGAVGDLVISPAKAGTPFPFRCFTADLFAVFDLSGFCRWQRVHTMVEANGALSDGTCGAARPPTAITSVSVRAGFLPRNIATRTCTNCSRASTSREVGFGCFWPAIGGTPTMRHQGNLFDRADGARLDFVVDWHL